MKILILESFRLLQCNLDLPSPLTDGHQQSVNNPKRVLMILYTKCIYVNINIYLHVDIYVEYKKSHF